jgi:hypothetical protein
VSFWGFVLALPLRALATWLPFGCFFCLMLLLLHYKGRQSQQGGRGTAGVSSGASNAAGCGTFWRGCRLVIKISAGFWFAAAA